LPFEDFFMRRAPGQVGTGAYGDHEKIFKSEEVTVKCGMGVTADIQLNHFEMALLEYIYRNPGATSQEALEKNRVDRGSGQIAIRYLGRLGLISMSDGGHIDKKLAITPHGVEMLKINGVTI